MLTKDEICALLRQSHPARVGILCSWADRIRKYTVGGKVHLRGLVEISNHCERHCLYCGLRKGNSRPRYRMTHEEIVAAARNAAARGIKTIVLQSGEDPELTAPLVARLVKSIKREMDVAVTLMLGEYSRDDYLEMKEAGADRYLLKHETADPRLYEKMHPGMSFENRVNCLRWLREAGFQYGSGAIVGLPGQTIESLADDILFLKELRADMIGIGVFIPHPGTPLAGEAAGGVELALKMVSIARLTLPYAHIPATTAIRTVSPSGGAAALRGGANVLMPNVTPHPYRGLYDLYPGRISNGETPEESIRNAVAAIHSVGGTVAVGYGHAFDVIVGQASSLSRKNFHFYSDRQDACPTSIYPAEFNNRSVLNRVSGQ